MQELERRCTNAVAFEHACGAGACTSCLGRIAAAARTRQLAQVDAAGNLAEQDDPLKQ